MSFTSYDQHTLNIRNMTRLAAYLTFDGNCREAMTHYQQCIGGDLDFQTVAESPYGAQLPPDMQPLILHAILRRNDFRLMGTDMIGEEGLIQGNGISLLMECSTFEQAQQLYEKLSAGGQASFPLMHNHWGRLFGGLTDRYGFRWWLTTITPATETILIHQNHDH